MGMIRLLLLAALAYLIYRWAIGFLRQGDDRQAKRNRDAGQRHAVPSPHEILGVATSASQEEIRSAYQRLIRQYHPDRVADMGPEIREVAERRAKEINAAYEQLSKS
jgi:preprotein translocase subunit Sec63